LVTPVPSYGLGLNASHYGELVAAMVLFQLLATIFRKNARCLCLSTLGYFNSKYIRILDHREGSSPISLCYDSDYGREMFPRRIEQEAEKLVPLAATSQHTFSSQSSVLF